MEGLDSQTFFQYLQLNPGIYIYCSNVTKLILKKWSRFRNLDNYLKVLNLDHQTQVKILDRRQSTETIMFVTAIPAGHCPGSIMLVLHTLILCKIVL